MQIIAYPRAVDPGMFRIWVGMFDCSVSPQTPHFSIRGNPIAPLGANQSMFRIRDGYFGVGGEALNYQGIFDFDAFRGAGRYDVQIDLPEANVPCKISAWALPDDLPVYMQGSFNILIFSCYYRPHDDVASSPNTIVGQIQLRPDLTLFAGDQIYGDLPWEWPLPETEPEFSQALSHRYYQNWVPPLAPPGGERLGSLGLQKVMSRAPSVFIPDDHEFWNNYPFAQAQLGLTGSDDGQKIWTAAAKALFHDYQVGGNPETATSGLNSLNVGPLRIMCVDMRSNRDHDFRNLIEAASLHTLNQWATDLIREQQAGKMIVAVLASGQPLFVKTALPLERSLGDAYLGNYEQFQAIEEIVTKLSDNGIPVVYVTGDVHWGRICKAEDTVRGADLYEVIVSPAKLCEGLLPEEIQHGIDWFKSVFGRDKGWPKHSKPKEPISQFGPARRYRPCVTSWPESDQEKVAVMGDQVAIASFFRLGSGVGMQVSYYGITSDPELSKSRQTQIYQLMTRK